MGDPTWVGRIGPRRRAASGTPPSPPVSTWMLAACLLIHVDASRGRLIGAGRATARKRGSRVFFTEQVGSNRSPPVTIYWTGFNQLNLKSNLKSQVQPVPIGLPAGLTGYRSV